MLRYLYLSVCLALVVTAADDLPNVKTRVVKTITSSVGSAPVNIADRKNVFETSHKIVDGEAGEFQSSHKITNQRPVVKDGSEADMVGGETGKPTKQQSSEELMQQQNPQNLLSTKEKPELNPVLSALINEDVMKSIESKRAIEEAIDKTAAIVMSPAQSTPVVEETKSPATEAAATAVTTSAPVNILTTSQQPIRAADDDAIGVGLVDQSVNLEVAGSENNQKSRIQIKKGPNGVDYEYEYVYYYYDDDDPKIDKTGGKQKGQFVAAESSSDVATSRGSTVKDPATQSSTRGKSRYTNIERSTTSTPDNEIVGRGRGRSNAVQAVDDVEEGRLPQNTRFPPRSRGGNEATPVPEASEPVAEKGGRRTGVKRPSLELIDSDTFNTDEKQVKTNRNLDSELTKRPSETVNTETKNVDTRLSDVTVEDTTSNDIETENTTPLMEKAALDLYAILANENLNIDVSTDDTVGVTTTDLPTTDTDSFTTVTEEETTVTTTESTTTTTTTTTPAPSPATGRRGLGTGSRNRFRLKNGSTTPPAAETSAEPKSSTKSKNRFGRPSFGSGRTSHPSKENREEIKEEVATKEESKPSSASSSSLRGKTRNRFNLRGSQATSTTEKSTADDNAIESKSASTTQRSLRGRPQLNIRGRGRPITTSTTSAPAEDDTVTSEKSPSGTRPSRFNLARPVGANRLLPRGRINPLKTTAASVTAESTDGSAAEGGETKDGEVAATPADENASSAAADDRAAHETSGNLGGLNRLKNRPKIQVQPKVAAKLPSPIIRKPNPLIGRRRIGLQSSTTEASGNDESDGAANSGDENITGDTEDPKDEAASVAAEQVVEASSEQPGRGLALLGNRRRLANRKPGALL